LQEQDDLEPLAVDAGEAEQREAEKEVAPVARPDLHQEAPPTAVVARDPPGPVDAVEEPVHDDEQDDDREHTGRGLDVEARTAEGAERSDDDEPGGERRATATSVIDAATASTRAAERNLDMVASVVRGPLDGGARW
jgi:hypothetical protein